MNLNLKVYFLVVFVFFKVKITDVTNTTEYAHISQEPKVAALSEDMFGKMSSKN